MFITILDSLSVQCLAMFCSPFSIVFLIDPVGALYIFSSYSFVNYLHFNRHFLIRGLSCHVISGVFCEQKFLFFTQYNF